MKKILLGALVCAAVAGVITPGPDIISQLTVAVPLFLLYEISIVLAKRVEKQRKLDEEKEWS